MPHVHVVNNHPILKSMINARPGYYLVEAEHLNLADMFIFPGGGDVDPIFYDEMRHPSTVLNPERNKMFFDLWQKICAPDKIKIGICGGGQFLNVMNGGRMWQDADGHAMTGTHEIIYMNEKGESETHDVTSTHHQIMIPSKYAEVWGFCFRSTRRDTGYTMNHPTNFSRDGPDHEILYYPKTRSLCFQPHPEYFSANCRDLFFKCLRRIAGE